MSSDPHPELDALLAAVRRRVNRLHAVRIAVFAFVGAAALIFALAAGLRLARGEEVPLWPFVVVPLAAAGQALLFYWHGRIDNARAAAVADRRFGLKDGLVSALHLRRSGDSQAADLQWQWLRERLDSCRPESIGRPIPRRLAAVGAVLAAAAVGLGLMPPSPEVVAAREEARETRERVESAKQRLEDLVEALDDEVVAPGERPVLEMDEFRKMVEKIEPTGDRTEAIRQFARMEQKIRDAARALDQRRDTETLKLAAAELGKAEETEPRQLARKLENKQLREAAEELEKLKQKPLDPEKLKDAKAKKRELAEAREELAKMRAVTKRLAAAGRQRQAAAEAGGGAGGGGAGAAGAGAGAAGAGGGQMAEADGEAPENLEDLMAELDDAAGDIEEALREVEIDPDAEWADGDFDGPVARANGLLDRFDGKLRRMHAKGRAQGKLDQMMRGLAEARGMAKDEDEEMQLQQLAGGGGKAPGTGSVDSRREGADDSPDGGDLAQLKGQHGDGPSLSAVESAESGTGVSGRRGEARSREFSRQVESFVQRDDIPDTLKLGVRNYFESLESAAPRPADGE